MAISETVERELAALEQIHLQFRDIANRTDDRRRHDLIELRRQLSAQIAKVGELAEPIVSGHDSTIRQAYRDHFSKMRSVAALHQANWPAVMLGQRDEEYAASGQLVRQSAFEFTAWMRQLVRSPAA
jgi:hypothetical protein